MANALFVDALKGYEYYLAQRGKANLDIFWLKDESLEGTENLPYPDMLAQEIEENLESALLQFSSIVEALEMRLNNEV
jgi:type I restriction enzyme M protein